MQLSVRPIDTVSINTGVTYADSVYTDFLTASGVQLAGNPLVNAPRWVGTLTGNLNQPLDDALALKVNVNYAYRSSTELFLATPASTQGSYGLLGLRVGVGSLGDQWVVGLYARNLFNKFFADGFYSLPGGNDREYSNAAGRTLGGYASYRF